MIKPLKHALLFLISGIGVGFYWGAAEALLNYYFPSAGVPRALDLLRSVNARALFYSITTFVILLAAAGAAAALRRIIPNTLKNQSFTFPVFVAVTLMLMNTVYWLTVGAFPALKFVLSAAVFVLSSVVFVITTRVLPGARRAFFYVAAAGVFIAVAFRAVGAYRERSRPVPAHLPDVYVISVDACRADIFSAGNAPRLTGYAAEKAVVFENAWAPTSWTTPSFASMFTGQYPDACIPRGLFLHDRQPTVAEVLYDAGYDTYFVTGNPVLGPRRGFTRGFKSYFYWEMSPVLLAAGYYETNLYYLLTRGFNLEKEPGEINRIITDRALQVIENDSDRAKFVWVHYLDPHSPYYPPVEYVSDVRKGIAADASFCLSDDVFIPANAAVLKDLYAGEIRALDDEVMTLFKSIEAEAPPAEYVIVFTSDHGEEFYEHGAFKHGKSVYNEVLRVPLFIKPPAGTAAPARVKDAVNVASIGPTILGLVGLPVPETMQLGALPIIPGETGGGILLLGSRMHNKRRLYAAVRGSKKLIVSKEDITSGGEYYVISTDPGEENPLPFDEEAEELRAALKRWIEENQKLAKASGAGAPGKVSDADLRALGYVK